jgi:uncharacterized protein (DUF885 family)
MKRLNPLAFGFMLIASSLLANEQTQPNTIPPLVSIPVSQHKLAFFVQRFKDDLASTEHTHDITAGKDRSEALQSLYNGWLRLLAEIDFNSLTLEDQIEYALFQREMKHRLMLLEFETKRQSEALQLLPGLSPLIELAEQRRALKPLNPEQAKRLINDAIKALKTSQDRLTKDSSGVSPTLAFRAAKLLDGFRNNFKEWNTFYEGFDPKYTHKVSPAYQALDKQLEVYSAFLRNDLARASNPETIIGDPIGRDAVEAALSYELIPYTPEQIIRIAEIELAWCQEELSKAAKEMGYSDWRAALESIKKDGPAVGAQPQYVIKLADEAVDFITDRNLVTVPELAMHDWRMTMLSPEYQLQAPFFLGGEDVWVAYPHDSMPEEKRQMALRGNNKYFSRAVVQHELIPGHHLQYFYNTRYNPQRQLYDTPFWSEGWALYWEFLLYQKGFARNPQERIGMLFWRSHRAARILFSLSFHMGTMTPEQAIDLLVTQVGHEPENAAAEVRRSFAGDYSPLYQAAYMLGGLQFWALRKELVDSGKMTDKAFHDAILKGGPMPVSVVRSRMLGQSPEQTLTPQWRFYPALNQP